MKIRPGTWDAAIAQAVMVDNEYDLPDDMKDMVVVDIGAHIGAFSAACAARGARRIICYEPDPQNFAMLATNMPEYSDNTQIELWNKAVTGVEETGLKLRHLKEHDFGGGANTGHVDVFGADAKDGITSIPINKVLEEIGERVDLLKIDCEGSEWSIFEHADLSKVDKIVAELHAITSGDHPMIAGFKDKSLAELTQQAVQTLCHKSFSPKIRSLTDSLGMLSAVRSSQATVIASNKVLWMGHAGIVSGYAKVTENICRRLFEKGWDVRIYGVGYVGQPHSYPYRVYPATQGDWSLRDIIKKMDPDVIVALDDHWNVSIRVQTLTGMGIYLPVVGYVAVDSENIRKDVVAQFRTLKHSIYHTQFGIEQMQAAGFSGNMSVAGHGTDLTIYTPYDKVEAREQVNITLSNTKLKDAFIWGVVGMNQPRKRIDLSLAYFAAWWHKAGKPSNAYIYVHCDPGGVWDIAQLADYLGIRGRILTTSNEVLPELHMPSMYSIFDAMISTAEGESWGMCHHEGMACGIPQIAVKCGGMPYWAKDAIAWVKPSQYSFTANRTNTKRWIASEEDFVAAMDLMYKNPGMREHYSLRGLELVKSLPSWDDIAGHFHTTLLQVINRAKAATSTNALDEFAVGGGM